MVITARYRLFVIFFLATSTRMLQGISSLHRVHPGNTATTSKYSGLNSLSCHMHSHQKKLCKEPSLLKLVQFIGWGCTRLLKQFLSLHDLPLTSNTLVQLPTFNRSLKTTTVVECERTPEGILPLSAPTTGHSRSRVPLHPPFMYSLGREICTCIFLHPLFLLWHMKVL